MAKRNAVDHAKNAVNAILKRVSDTAKANKKSETGSKGTDWQLHADDVQAISVYVNLLQNAALFHEPEVKADGEAKPKSNRGRKPKKAVETAVVAEVPAETPAIQ